jgi:hypothetical protein
MPQMDQAELFPLVERQCPAIVGDDTLNSIAYYLRLLVGCVEETQSSSIGLRQGVILISI